MNPVKRAILAATLLDNFLGWLPRKVLFKTRWKLQGQCRQCGICCQEIYLKATPGLLASGWFLELTVRWLSWLYGFIYLRTDRENNYIIFTCRHKRPDGRCGNYFWRPNVCRNYPLVDYFAEPGFLPGCGYHAVQRGSAIGQAKTAGRLPLPPAGR